MIKGGITFLTVLFKIDNWFRSQNWHTKLHRGIGSMAAVWTYVRPTNKEQDKRTPQYGSIYFNTQEDGNVKYTEVNSTTIKAVASIKDRQKQSIPAW